MDSKTVLDIFKSVMAIPRESGHEEQITHWLKNWAESHSLECRIDGTGNVLIRKEASKGKESVPAIVLQAHQDMVCEKTPGSKHDFSKDPIYYEIRDGWMVAPETTLGADDGIGIAAALALLEDNSPMGPVECLFTISEETGMDGAEALMPGFFSGKTLINLDSEDEGQLFIGCAGGLNTNIKFSYGTEAVKDGYSVVRLVAGGGIGGHSGDDINKERANMVQLMVRFLYSRLGTGLQLIEIKGGGKPNAIARDCSAVVAVNSPEELTEAFSKFAAEMKIVYHVTDPALDFVAEKVSGTFRAIDTVTAQKLVSSLFTCPHGVQAMSQDIAGLVETSTNLASVRMEEPGIVEVVTSQRSSIQSERRMIAAKVRANFEIAGATVKHLYEYPGWMPNVNSSILKQSVESYRRLFGTDPEVKAIHAGLECGLFLEKFPGLDMISFGPTLRGVHAPGEKLELASLDKFVDLLKDVVINFS